MLALRAGQKKDGPQIDTRRWKMKGLTRRLPRRRRYSRKNPPHVPICEPSSYPPLECKEQRRSGHPFQPPIRQNGGHENHGDSRHRSKLSNNKSLTSNLVIPSLSFSNVRAKHMPAHHGVSGRRQAVSLQYLRISSRPGLITFCILSKQLV